MSRSSSSRAHLGETAAALVDGELGHAARDSALAHLAHCELCRAEVDEQRRTKVRLAELGRPAVPDDLVARLQGIGTSGLVRPAYRPPVPDRRPPSAGGSRRPAGRRSQPLAGRPRRRLALSGVAAVLLVGLGTAFVAGGSTVGGPPVSPAVDGYAVEHAATTGGVSYPESAVGAAVSASFAGSTAP